MVEQVFYSVSDNQERPPLPETASPAYQKLIQDCWAPNPETRPAFTEICARLRELVGSNAPSSRAGSFTEAMCAQNGIAQSPSVGLSPPGSPVQRSGLSFTLGNGSPQLSPVGNLESPRRRNSFSVGAASAGEESPGRDRGATVAICESGDGSPTGERSPRGKSQAPWGVVNGLHHQARAHKSRFSYVGPRVATPDPGTEVLSE
jgi:hypothetical protein